MSQAEKKTDESTQEVTLDTPPVKLIRSACPPAPKKEKVSSDSQNNPKPTLSSEQARQLRDSWSEYSKEVLEHQ